MDHLSHLFAGFQERLSAEIREKRGWAYWLGPIDWRLPGAGAFGIVTAVPKKHMRETERLIRKGSSGSPRSPRRTMRWKGRAGTF